MAVRSRWLSQSVQRVNAVGLIGAVVPDSDGGLLATLLRVPPALGAVFRASEWIARVRGPEFVLRQFTAETVDTETENIVYRDFRQALDGRPAGAVRETSLFTGEWSLPDPDAPIHAWHGVADENVRIDPVRTAYADRSNALLSELDTDHLGTLLTVREALVDLAATGSENERADGRT